MPPHTLQDAIAAARELARRLDHLDAAQNTETVRIARGIALTALDMLEQEHHGLRRAKICA